ncbi:MAG: 4-hydroxybenzoate octaprenyltransferase [Caulobacter sp.]|nr:4-hydroxybenzoate octaprenyltransferase [Caulobacter sp.]
MTRASDILPDAAVTNWVDRHAPPGLRPWLKLGRFDRPAGIWLLMLPGWMGIALAGAMAQRWPDPVLLVQFLVGAALMRAAGCAFNDIVDRDFDAQVARTAMRPIPAGQITVPQAWGFLIGCALVSFLILLSMNLWAVGLGIASLGLVAAYPFMKRITWWPQAWLGLTFNWGAPLGFAAAMGGPSLFSLVGLGPETPMQPLSPWPAGLLYAGLIFWTLGYDTIYAVQDLEDDALAGVKSSARRLGEAAPRGVMIFYVACFCLVLLAGWVGGLGPLMLPLLAGFGLHLSRQAARLRLDDPMAALALFKSNVWAGALLVAALVAGLWRPTGF